jgi:hypothetical protein
MNNKVRHITKDDVGYCITDSARRLVWRFVLDSVTTPARVSVRESIWTVIGNSVKVSIRDTASGTARDYFNQK